MAEKVRGHKVATNLNGLTPTTGKALLRELTGMGHLQVAAVKAKGRRQALEHSADLAAAAMPQLETAVEKIPDLVLDVDGLQLQVDEAVQKKGQLAGAEREQASALEGAHAEAAEQERLQAKIDAAAGELKRLEQARSAPAAAIAAAGAVLERQPAAQKTLAQIEELEAEQGRLRDERTKTAAEQQRLINDYERALEAHRTDEAPLRQQASAATVSLEKERGSRQEVQALIERVLAELESDPNADECPTCHQALESDEAHEHVKQGWRVKNQDRDKLQSRAFELDQSIIKLEGEDADADARLQELTVPSRPELPGIDEEAERRVAGQLEELSPVAVRGVIQQAAGAQGRKDEAERQLAEIQARAAGLEADRAELEKQLDADVARRMADAATELDKTRADLQEVRESLAGLAARREAIETELAQARQKESELTELRARVEQQREDAGRWGYLENALGPNGVQALELEAQGPGIAEIANNLLEASFGSRFRVRMAFTQDTGQGAERSQKETFKLVVFDAEHADEHNSWDLRPGEQYWDTVSGGEGVWIREALYNAFAVARERVTGAKWLTRILDEADDGLDAGMKPTYFGLIEAAHHSTDRHQTICVTHAPQIKQMIGQSIDLEQLAESAVAQEVAS